MVATVISRTTAHAIVPDDQVPRVLGVVGVGGGAAALSRLRGSPSDIALAISGIAFGAVLLFGERREFPAMTATLAGSLVGGFFALLLLTDDFESNVTVGTVRILVGATIASARYHIRHVRDDESGGSASADGPQHR